MRNTAVRSAGEALPAGASLSRRSMFGGIVAAPALALPALASSVPTSQKDIARRVHDLAAEMSQLLEVLDGGSWLVRVTPARSGISQYDMQPAELSANIRLEQGLTIARAALTELQPGAWRSGHNVMMGFAFITSEAWRFERPADLRGGLRQC